jgi:UDP-2-acetamido-2-deoxy-ribo-hexuluronate aminotransferase
MSGYKIKFNGIDRLYDKYSWRLTKRAKQVWESGQVLQGSYQAELEKTLAEQYKRKYAIAVGSATDGLYFALKSLGLNSQSKIVCPAFGYIAMSGAIKRLGAKPIFVDVDNNGNLGLLSLGLNPDAVLYANLFGNLADYENIKAFCDSRKIPLIEDAAQSIGAIYKKIPSGKLGDVSVFSFDPMKNLPVFGTGGMVLTDNDKVYKNIIALRRHGLGSNYEYGYNSLMSEDHCNQLLFLFDKFKSLQKKRKEIVSWYFELLSKLKFIKQDETTGLFRKTTISSYHKLVLLADKRSDLQKHLESHGIETKIHYKRTLDSTNFGRYPNAERLCSHAISLPIYPFLKDIEVEYICKTIKAFYGI